MVGIGVFVAAIWIVTGGGLFERTAAPAVTGPTDPADPPVAVVPGVDYVIDLNTGAMTPLPEAIIRSVDNSFEDQYAVSPDGSQLAYVGNGGGEPQIFIADTTAPGSGR